MSDWLDASVILVDPPAGWRYGFPRVWDRKAHPDMVAWLIANGYPEKNARSEGLTVRFLSMPKEQQ